MLSLAAKSSIIKTPEGALRDPERGPAKSLAVPSLRAPCGKQNQPHVRKLHTKDQQPNCTQESCSRCCLARASQMGRDSIDHHGERGGLAVDGASM
eukprot:576815-Amphidinium_carterae.1